MAIHINAGKDVGRTDIFHIMPIHILVDEALNGRQQAHGDETVMDLARSILTFGQQQPVTVRRLANKKVQLVSGYRRWKAVSLINTTLQPDNPVKLQCRVIEANDEEAFTRNLIENHDRESTTPIDDAHNIRRLREVYSWDDEKILALYRRSPAWLAQTTKLLQLPNKVQEEVSRGNLAKNDALDLTELSPAEQKEAMDEGRDDTGRIASGAVKERVRKSRQAEGKGKSRTMSDLRKYFDRFTGDDTEGPLKELANAVLDYIKGQNTDRQMDKALERLVGS